MHHKFRIMSSSHLINISPFLIYFDLQYKINDKSLYLCHSDIVCTSNCIASSGGILSGLNETDQEWKSLSQVARYPGYDKKL